MMPQAHLGLGGDLNLIPTGLERFELKGAYLYPGITAVVTEGKAEFKVGRLSATPENPVVDGRLLGGDRTVLDRPHPGHPFPSGQILAIEDRGEAFFDFGGVQEGGKTQDAR